MGLSAAADPWHHPGALSRLPTSIRPRLVALCTALVLLTAAPASAQSRCVEQLTDAEVETRYQMIYEAMEGQQTWARWWYFGWLSFFSTLVVTNSVFAAVEFDDARPRYIAGLLGSSLSILSFTVFPRVGLKTAFATRRLDRQPAGTPAERRERLRYAEALLQDTAERQKLGTSFMSHAQGFAWGLGSSLIIGLKYDDTVGALTLAFGSPIINEARALTSPTGSIAAWERYRSAAKHCMAPTLRKRPRPTGPTMDFSAGLRRVRFTLRWF